MMRYADIAGMHLHPPQYLGSRNITFCMFLSIKFESVLSSSCVGNSMSALPGLPPPLITPKSLVVWWSWITGRGSTPGIVQISGVIESPSLCHTWASQGMGPLLLGCPEKSLLKTNWVPNIWQMHTPLSLEASFEWVKTIAYTGKLHRKGEGGRRGSGNTYFSPQTRVCKTCNFLYNPLHMPEAQCPSVQDLLYPWTKQKKKKKKEGQRGNL